MWRQRNRPGAKRLHRIRNAQRKAGLKGHVAGRRSLRCNAQEQVVGQILARQRPPAREHLGQNQAQGVHVGPRAGGAKLLGAKLLGRAIAWRKRPEAAAGLGDALGGRLALLHRFGDAEVQDLHQGPALGLRLHQIAGLDVAVRQVLAVGKGQGIDGRPQITKGLGFGKRL